MSLGFFGCVGGCESDVDLFGSVKGLSFHAVSILFILCNGVVGLFPVDGIEDSIARAFSIFKIPV